VRQCGTRTTVICLIVTVSLTVAKASYAAQKDSLSEAEPGSTARPATAVEQSPGRQTPPGTPAGPEGQMGTDLQSKVSGPTTGEPAIDVFVCRFDEQWDVNWDHWPDGWKRRKGPGFPSYIRMAMEPLPVTNEPPVRDRTFVVRMNGGNAAVESPSMRLSHFFSYHLTCRLRLVGMNRFRVAVAISSYDSQEQRRERFTVEAQTNTEEWQTVELGPWEFRDPQSQTVVIGLEIEADSPEAIRGQVHWDDIHLRALPRVALSADRALPYYALGEQPKVVCRISGLRRPEVQLRYLVFDVHDAVLADTQLTLPLQKMNETFRSPNWSATALFEGTSTWTVPVQGPGYYRVEARIYSDQEESLARQQRLVLLGPAPGTPGPGVYGWTFPPHAPRLPVRHVAQLAPLAGLGWVKYPVWFGEQDTRTGEELAELAERLGTWGIQLVGLLDNPPEAQRRKWFGESSVLPVASVFRDADVWQHLLSPVMTRLSLKVRWWQLGADDDISYSGYPHTPEQVEAVRKYFERFGQEARLVVPWNWLEPQPDLPQAPWANFSFYTRPALSAEELGQYLEAQRSAGKDAWVFIEPLDEQYALQTRVADLVQSMILAHQHGASGVFVPNPFDSSSGLIFQDGSPQPLFLPWRTTALMLGQARYLGALTLSQGSRNAVFVRDGQVVLALWNERPVEEEVFVGASPSVEVWDVWGRTGQGILQQDGSVLRVGVGPVPLFITGIHPSVIQWQLQFSIDKTTLDTSSGSEQTLRIQFPNTFAHGITGEIVVRPPATWNVYPQRMRFLAAPDEKLELPLRVLLGPTSASGRQMLRFDVEVVAEHTHRFQILRPIVVGDTDLAVQVTTWLTESGDLVVEQHLINASDTMVSFNCTLFIPDRARQRKQVLYMGRGQRTDRYVIPDGASLVGRTLWLRAVEIAGKGRTLNYEIPVSE
jgi:hypothetical protein